MSSRPPPRIFYVAWRWARSTSSAERARARHAIGGWVAAIGFRYAWRANGSGDRGQQLYVFGLRGSRRRRGADPMESGRAIASFVVNALEARQHEGPIRSGLRTSKLGARVYRRRLEAARGPEIA